MTNANTYPCPHCQQPITRRGRASHTKAKHPEHYTPRPKYQSRATRLAAAVAAWNVGAIESARDDVQTWLDEFEDVEDATKREPLAGLIIPEDFDVSEVESLKEEMESWRDNLEDKLSHTQKYEEVSEAADTLDTICSAVEDVNSALDDARSAYDPASNDADDIRGVLEALEEAINAAENASSEDVNFPGMY